MRKTAEHRKVTISFFCVLVVLLPSVFIYLFLETLLDVQFAGDAASTSGAVQTLPGTVAGTGRRLQRVQSASTGF